MLTSIGKNRASHDSLCLYSQYEYSHETFFYKDDLRGGDRECLISRMFSKRRNAPLSRICDRSLVFEGAKTQICELSNVSLFRNIEKKAFSDVSKERNI
jgi:hypothetical protein